MSKKILILLLAITSFASVAYIIVRFEERKHILSIYQVKTDSLEKALSSTQYQLADYRDRMKIGYENEATMIDSRTIVVVDGKEKQLLAFKRKCLFVRISTSNCWSCIKSISTYINNHVDRDINIVYLMDAPIVSIASDLITYAELKRPVYLTKREINLPVESIGEPYMFYINEKEMACMVLMPIKGDDYLLDLYFNTLKNKIK
jgi:hypothetical protein